MQRVNTLFPWDDSALQFDVTQPTMLGCTICPDRALCGGLRIRAGVFECQGLCACMRGGECSGVCRRNSRTFVDRVAEVGGFGFDNVPRHRPTRKVELPHYLPIIYNGTDRNEKLDVGAVALPLASMFDRSSGRARFAAREDLLSAFKLARATRIILTGVAPDQVLERWWSFSSRPALIEHLYTLGVELVTGPNYSLFTDVSRYDNLHNMKRIAIIWSEFMAGGMTCALHVNARTDTDYKRWRDFVAERVEVSCIAFEFTTGTASMIRGPYHRDQLVALAEQAARPLTLVVRGGRRYLRELTCAYRSVSILDADPYLKTKYRQRARLTIGADIDWYAWPTLDGQPLDELMRHNIVATAYAESVRRRWFRTDHGDGESPDVHPLLEASPA